MSNIIQAFSDFFQSIYNAVVPQQRYLAYLEGAKNTIAISFLAILLGIGIGIIVAVAKFSAVNFKVKFLKRLVLFICNTYITIIRGTPVMLQLLIIYNLIFTSRYTNEILVAALCFGINSGAYVAEIIRAGIESIDRGQMEAGRTLGLSHLKVMRLIIMPQAIRNILPALGNEFIVLIKETSVAGAIAVTDILKSAQYIGAGTWDILPPYYVAAAIYLIMVLGLTKLLAIFERRLAKGDNH
ncbi:MAG: putative rane protein [Herbinix sp.]|nr:putative rane protein [Herbinix sp.]